MNHQLDLDFIQTPFFSYSKSGLFLFVMSLAAIVFVWQKYQVKSSEYSDLSGKLVQFNQAQKKPVLTRQSAAISPEKTAQLQQTVNALTMPWDALFTTIEQADMKDIALLSLEPNSQKQQVVITAEAKNLQAALAYVARLEMQPALSQVFLQKHSIAETDVSKPVSFTVFAKWDVR